MVFDYIKEETRVEVINVISEVVFLHQLKEVRGRT